MEGFSTDNQVARQLQQIQNKSIAEFHQNLKASMLLKDDMPDFLSSAPLVINLLGHIRLLAWSNAATVDIVREVDSSFKSNKLSVNLVHLYQQGHKAFATAGENMGAINDTLQALFGRSGLVFGILECLTDPSGQSSLQERMSRLSSGMDDCVNRANATRREMDTWGDMAGELARATNSEFATMERRIKEYKLDRDLLNDSNKIVEHLMNNCAKVLEIERKKYMEAESDVKKAKKKNRGLSTFGLVSLVSITNPILETIHHATSLVGKTPGLIEKLANPTIGIGASSNGDSRQQQNPVQASIGRQQAPTNTRVVTNEMAYTKAYAISELVSELQSLSEGGLEDSKTEMRGLLAQAEHLCRDIQPSSKPSRDACHILNDCRKIITEMLKKSEKSITLNVGSPGDNRWAAKLEEMKASAAALELEASSQPGQAFGDHVPILNPQMFIRDTGSIDVNAFLNRRQEDLARKELACATALSNFEKRAESYAANQREIIEIAHKLNRLHNKEVTTAQIRDVLREAAGLMERLQGEMANLSTYFIRIKGILDRLQKYECLTLTTEINNALGRGSAVAGLSFSEFQAQIICSNLLILRGHAGCIASSCEFYYNVSGTHLLPLFAALYNLPLDPDHATRQDAINKLEAKTNEAAEKIRSSGRERILSMKSAVEQMGRLAQSQREGLPQLPISQKTSLKAAAREVKEQQSSKIDNTEMPASTVHILRDLGDL
ncbi:hypothetical protein ONZ43_g796 [Nemania bipapillata]|uniref:Uncharacterized protein n=1 Tax=Nemania bipapillata TaxID=110536 RepID=A0ACC2J6T0_9PEZI|nr:hypothetical protein ONZ43_g796 [Nemania bipapillata]